MTLFSVRTKAGKWLRLPFILGLRGALVYAWQAIRRKYWLQGRPYSLLSRQAAHPLWCRPDTSDRRAFDQVFIFGDYSALAACDRVELIIDCGANVGYASAYLLTRFPECQLIAIEPDPTNYRMLQRNLQPYGSRGKLIGGGVWSTCTGLKMVETPYRDGQAWTRQVRAVTPDEELEVEGFDLPTLLAGSGRPRVSILKMDVEGAEAVVFGGDVKAWLRQVDHLAIELHDDSVFGNASSVFFDAIAGQPFRLSQSGPLTICQRCAPDES